MSANQEISSRIGIGPSLHVSQYVSINPLPCKFEREKERVECHQWRTFCTCPKGVIKSCLMEEGIGIANLTLTSVRPRCSVLKPPIVINDSFISAVMCIFSDSPVDSMRDAVFTVSPNRQYRGILDPTMPATTGPV